MLQAPLIAFPIGKICMPGRHDLFLSYLNYDLVSNTFLGILFLDLSKGVEQFRNIV